MTGIFTFGTSKAIRGCLWAGLSALAAAAVQGETRYDFSLDEVFSIPGIREIQSNIDGDLAWVEQQDGGWNVLVARSPDYEPRQLTRFDDDAGHRVDLVGFDAQGALIYRLGDWGVNPSLSPMGPTIELHRVAEGDRAPESLAKLTDAWSASPAFTADRKALFVASGGTVSQWPVKRGSRGEALFSIRGVVKSLALSPNGQHLAFTVDRSNLNRGKYAYAGVYDLASKTITYMQPGLGVDQDLSWSPDGSQLAFIRFGYEPRTWRFSDHRAGAPFQVIVADPSNGKGKVIFESEPGYGSRFNGFAASTYSGMGGTNNLLWLADGQLLFPYEKTGWKLLYSVPADGGEARLLTPGKFEISGMAPSIDGQSVFFWANTEADPHRLAFFSLTPGKAPSAVAMPESLPMAGDAPRQSLYALPGGVMAVIAQGAEAPTQLRLLLPSGNSRKLSTGPDVDDPLTDRMPAPEIITFKARDGLEIPGVLYRPAEPLQTGSNSLVVVAHGGSRDKAYPIWGFEHTRDQISHYLSGQGYYVYLPNYRSGIGYGLDFREPDQYGGRGAADAEDAIDAARYLKRTLDGVDPEKFAILGYSYGGHIVTNALARSDEYAAGVSYAGVGDWVIEMEKDFKETLQFNIPQRVELEAMAHEASAISLIDEWGDEPLLLVHGDNDGSAAMQQSLELYLALKRRGKTTEALIYPEETHGFNRSAHRREIILRTDAFLKTHLQ